MISRTGCVFHRQLGQKSALFYFILYQFSDLEVEPMVVMWRSIHEECARTDNSNCDRPLKVAPHSPNAFPMPFVTQSPPSTLILMHLQYPVLTILDWWSGVCLL